MPARLSGAGVASSCGYWISYRSPIKDKCKLLLFKAGRAASRSDNDTLRHAMACVYGSKRLAERRGPWISTDRNM